METNSRPRAAIYARLSTAQIDRDADRKEESDSIANQIRDLKALAKRLDYEVVHVFKDDGVSGYKGKHRDGFQKLLRAIADAEVDIVLVRHQDRLERNREEATMIQAASIKAKVQWRFADGQLLDPSTAGGGLLADILSAIARFESAVKTERLLMHYEGKRISGTFQAPPGTFGYLRENVVEWEAQLIREAYEAIDAGKTMGSIVRLWNKNKVEQRKNAKRGWTYAHIRSILQRPRNAGLVADKDGEIIEGLVGQWQPIVDVKLWHRVNGIINDPNRPSSPGFTPRWLGAGLAKCGICGQPMRSNTVSDRRSGTRYSILKCSRLDKSDGVRHPSARNEDIHHPKTGKLMHRGLEWVIRNEVINAFAYGPSSLLQEHGTPDIGAIQMELAHLTTKRAEIRQDYRDEILTRAEYIADLKATEAPMQALQDRLNVAVASSASASMLVDLRTGLRDEQRRASMDAMTDLKLELGERFDALDIDQRRRLVRQLLDVRVHRGRLETNPRKFEIRHTRVESLNDDSQP